MTSLSRWPRRFSSASIIFCEVSRCDDLDLVGRRGPHLALRDLLEPLVDVVDGLAGVVLPHDPAEHVAQLRGEEARRQHAVAQQQALRHRDVPADPSRDAGRQLPEGRDQARPVPRLLLGVRGLHELGHQVVDALPRLALAREHRAVVVLVDEERLGRLLELPDRLEFLPGGVDALRRGGPAACSSPNRVPKSGSPSPPRADPRRDRPGRAGGLTAGSGSRGRLLLEGQELRQVGIETVGVVGLFIHRELLEATGIEPTTS